MNLKKVHHIAIIGSNYEQSKHFYMDLLGFSIIRENYRPERDDYKLDIYTGKRMTFFYDPDNLPLEIHE